MKELNDVLQMLAREDIQKGVGIGAGVGALLGASQGDVVKNSIVGAAVGAAMGWAIEQYTDSEKSSNAEDIPAVVTNTK